MTDYLLTVADIVLFLLAAGSFAMAVVAFHAALDHEDGRPGLWTVIFLVVFVLAAAGVIALKSPAG